MDLYTILSVVKYCCNCIRLLLKLEKQQEFQQVKRSNDLQFIGLSILLEVMAHWGSNKFLIV